MKWVGLGEILSSLLTIVFSGILFGYFTFMTYIVFKSFAILEDLRPKIGSFYNGLNLSRGKSVLITKIIYYARRIAIPASVVYNKNIVI